MSHRVTLPRLSLFLVLGALLGTGCKPGLPPMSPVKGKVTVDGQPLTGGKVAFLPATNDEANVGLSAGDINSDGTYEIHTAGQSGAPLGKYKVTVSPAMTPGQGTGAMTMPFSQKFGDPRNTPFQSIEVVQNPTPGQYDLKLTK